VYEAAGSREPDQVRVFEEVYGATTRLGVWNSLKNRLNVNFPHDGEDLKTIKRFLSDHGDQLKESGHGDQTKVTYTVSAHK
jgi:hypothetical protein